MSSSRKRSSKTLGAFDHCVGDKCVDLQEVKCFDVFFSERGSVHFTRILLMDGEQNVAQLLAYGSEADILKVRFDELRDSMCTFENLSTRRAKSNFNRGTCIHEYIFGNVSAIGSIERKKEQSAFLPFKHLKMRVNDSVCCTQAIILSKQRPAEKKEDKIIKFICLVGFDGLKAFMIGSEKFEYAIGTKISISGFRVKREGATLNLILDEDSKVEDIGREDPVEHEENIHFFDN
ncbi:hypothetical protein L596_030184 [Steinernema carpocapsae]|uniref:Uncharacterized protein n=1 Tax=Steinernema carpocapsae TaxID=34508 RepID=A0A4U5LRZ2_STECR|nr:hypothetical protein L596_030184 [Steinernema carpocapsae]